MSDIDGLNLRLGARIDYRQFDLDALAPHKAPEPPPPARPAQAHQPQPYHRSPAPPGPQIFDIPAFDAPASGPDSRPPPLTAAPRPAQPPAPPPAPGFGRYGEPPADPSPSSEGTPLADLFRRLENHAR